VVLFVVSGRWIMNPLPIGADKPIVSLIQKSIHYLDNKRNLIQQEYSKCPKRDELLRTDIKNRLLRVDDDIAELEWFL